MLMFDFDFDLDFEWFLFFSLPLFEDSDDIDAFSEAVEDVWIVTEANSSEFRSILWEIWDKSWTISEVLIIELDVTEKKYFRAGQLICFVFYFHCCLESSSLWSLSFYIEEELIFPFVDRHYSILCGEVGLMSHFVRCFSCDLSHFRFSYPRYLEDEI